jgi:hypothetical protein
LERQSLRLAAATERGLAHDNGETGAMKFGLAVI